MCTLRDNFTSLSTLDARVYGISGDYVYAHREWARHHKLQFPLMSDHDHRVARAYNSYNARTGYNRRTVYVIDRDGHIAYMDTVYSVATPDSFERLTRALTELRGGSR
jgi:peroxiredoxin Q/BCP